MKQNYIETILGGLTFLIAISFLFKFMEVNSDKKSEDSYLLKAKFLKVGGIMIGNDVKMSGVKIGVVSNVMLDEEYFAEVTFKVYSTINVPEEVSIEVSNDGILGNKYLSITPSGDLSIVLNEKEEIKKVEDYESIEDQVSKIIFLATQ